MFPEKCGALEFEVDLVAELTVINPFDFFLEPQAENWPFPYEAWLTEELRPYLVAPTPGPALAGYWRRSRATRAVPSTSWSS